jgi:hypothetical protein
MLPSVGNWSPGVARLWVAIRQRLTEFGPVLVAYITVNDAADRDLPRLRKLEGQRLRFLDIAMPLSTSAKQK